MPQPVARLRHLVLLLNRLALGACVVVALPLAHMQWGESYPGDGQRASGFILVFIFIGLAAACVFVALGSLAQFLLRSRPPLYTVLADAGLCAIFAGLLIYGGVTAKYSDAAPSQAPDQPDSVQEAYLKAFQRLSTLEVAHAFAG